MEQQEVKGLVVAGLSGGSGKSMVTVGLARALMKDGNRVVPFKKGPDYIDAGWLSAAARTPCYNLDPYLMTPQILQESFQIHLSAGDLALVEGNRGVYDGVNLDGEFSTAALAKQLDLPVLLVVNCTKTTRTVGAMVLGCCMFDRGVEYAGVVLNQVATPRHESIIRQTLEKYTPLKVLGIMPRLRHDIFPMRHLGVTPLQEYANAEEAVEKLADLVRTNVDLGSVTQSMKEIPVTISGRSFERLSSVRPVTIGVLRDMAFQFYYEENLEALQREGAELVNIDALSASELPENLDGLYIGGGFPETSAQQLAENVSFRHSVRARANEGLPIYAECGGLIYLGKSILIEGHEFPLTGVFPVVFGLSKKPQAHGYSIFTVEGDTPFYPVGTQVKGHEFRYSTIEEWDGKEEDLVVRMERGTGFHNGLDGLRFKNVLAMYTHVLAPGTPLWAKGLVDAARKYRKR